MPKLSIIKTEDGSESLFSEIFNESYHSINGAMSESMYVFIGAGLNFIPKKEISIFEVGFGSGLNALLTYDAAEKRNLEIDYTSIEFYPVEKELYEKIVVEKKELFLLLHESKWNAEIKISAFFRLTKINDNFTNYNHQKKYDLVYFDAFSFDKQPEMWSEEVFVKLFANMNANGILVTYSAKGIVKQNLKKAGFEVQRLPGYKKHHMLRAIKKV